MAPRTDDCGWRQDEQMLIYPRGCHCTSALTCVGFRPIDSTNVNLRMGDPVYIQEYPTCTKRTFCNDAFTVSDSLDCIPSCAFTSISGEGYPLQFYVAPTFTSTSNVVYHELARSRHEPPTRGAIQASLSTKIRDIVKEVYSAK